MLLIRPVSPRPFGRSGRTVRRYLVIEKRYRPRPKIGQRRYVFDDLSTVTGPTVMLCTPARLEWNDVEFRDIRQAVAKHFAAGHRLAELSDEHEDFPRAQVDFGLTWGECEHLAYQVFSPEPLTIRDLFLRAEMLTMHYGDDQLAQLIDSECPAHRMLGGLLQAMWKVGGAANV